MKKAFGVMLVLLMLQLVSLCMIMIVVLDSHSNILPILLTLLSASFLADCLLLRSIRRNSRVEELEVLVSAATERRRLESSYQCRIEAWQSESTQMRGLLSDQLLQAEGRLMWLEQERAQHPFGQSAEKRQEFLTLLETMKQNVDSLKTVRYCDHFLSNIILVEKQKQAAAQSISMEIRAVIPQSLVAAEHELCSIWCNLLDNSIEACGRMTDDTQPWIRVNAGISGDYLCIRVENSLDRAAPPIHYRTQKDDEMQHGYGLRIVKELAQRYGGSLLLKQEKGMHIAIFTISAVETARESGL